MDRNQNGLEPIVSQRFYGFKRYPLKSLVSRNESELISVEASIRLIKRMGG